MKTNYLSPQLKVLNADMRHEVLTTSDPVSEEVPVIGSQDLDIDFNQPTPGSPEDAF